MAIRILAKRGTEAQITSVSSADQLAGEISFATDTKDFYVSDGTQFNKIGKDQLSQFSEISVESNIDTWHLSNTNKLALSPPEGNSSGITFKPDGTKVFTIGYSRNRVQSYDLSTAWDLTSAGSPTESEYLVQNNLGSTQEDLFIDSSGTRMYVLSRSSDSVGQFTLNTAWDISDITFVRDVHINNTALSGGVAGFVTGEGNPMGITFKPDGTIMYLVGYTTDDVFQIPLSTAWDISTHGTVTSVDVSSEATPSGIQFNNDGTVMYIMGYSSDAIHQYNLSTAWDVTTASFVKRTTPFIRPLEGTGNGFYYNETEQKAFVCGRSSDFAYEVIISEAIRFSDPVSAEVLQGDKVIANELMTGYTGRNDFFNTINTHSTFQSNSATYLGYNTGAQNVRVGNTVYGNYRFHVFQHNYINSDFISNPTGALPNIRFFNPLIGGVGVFSIGKTHNTGSSYLLGGVTDIESEADTFDHKGEITLGGELKVAGNQPLKYKDPNLYTQGTQIVLDNFTESTQTTLDNHTPDTGSGYTNVYISPNISFPTNLPIIEANNGFLRPAVTNSNDGYRFVNDTTISTANYEARAVIRKQSSGDDPFVLFVKYIDEDNYFAMHFAGNYSYCTPMSVVGGVHTQHGALYYYANTSTANDVNFEVALRVVGNNVHLFYEGRYRGSREVNITGIGKAGIGFGRSNDSILTGYDLTTNAQISKFEIYELPDSLFDGSDSVHYIENGKVGIGTTSPSSKLHLLSTTHSTFLDNGILLDVDSSDEGEPAIAFRNQSDMGSNYWIAGINNGGQNLDFAYGTQFTSANTNVRFTSDGKVGIGTTSPSNYANSAESLVVASSGDTGITIATTNTNKESNLYFADGTTGDETYRGGFNYKHSSDLMQIFVGGAVRAAFDSTGKLGIGTTSPAGILHAYSTSAPVIESPSNAAMIIRRNDNTNYSSLLKYHSGNSEKFVAGLSDAGDFTDSTGEEYFIGTTKTNPLLVLKNDGKLGIGTTSPAYKLHVNGTARFEDAITLSDDVNNRIDASATGLLFKSAAHFSFTKGENTLMYIKETGSVGIGTTSPARLLHVDGSSGARISYESANMDLLYYGIEFNRQSNYLRPTTNSGKNLYIGSGSQNYTWTNVYLDAAVVQFRNSSSEPLMRFDSSTGRLGIGTTSASEILHIGGGGNIRVDGSEIYITQASSSRKPVRLHQASYKGAITLQRDGVDNVNISSDQPQHGHTYFNGDGVNVGIGTTSPSVKLEIGTDGGGENKLRINSDVATKYLQFESLGNFSRIRTTNGQNLFLDSAGAGGYITFNTNGAERMRVLYDGKVGIGTTSPAEKLDVNGNIVLGDGGTGSSLNFNSTDRGVIKVNGSERMRIASDGNVGIGTTSPSEKLHVVGNIKASGTIKGKMEQMFACSFSDDLGTTKHYLSFTSNAEQTNVHADQAAMVMPYGGRVKCIQMRLSNIDGDATRTFGVETIAPGVNMYASSNNWTIEETEAYEITADDDFYLVNYVFSNETHFDSGDLLAISIQDSEDAYTASRQTYVNVIIEYDLNNGMGNDTATTKYTS